MLKIIVYFSAILGILFLSGFAHSASLVYKEDFEDNNAADTFGTAYLEYWNIHLGSTQVVTNSSHGGSYSFRGSLSENSTPDNITGEPGSPNSHCSMGQGATNYGNTSDFDVSSIDTGEFYLSWWIKFDQGELANLLSDSHKMLYLYTNGTANYVILQVTSSGRLRLIVNADNNGGYPYTAGDEPPYYQYGYTLGDFPSLDDGSWHHVEFYADWGTGGGANSILRFWLDGEKLLDVSNAVAIYQTGDEPWTLTLPSNISAASTTITTVGWQVDDIQIWDGMPTDGTDQEPDPEPDPDPPLPPFLHEPVTTR